MNRPRFALIAASALLATSFTHSAFAASTPCVAAGGNAVIEWTASAKATQPVRVYFRSADSAIEHYVEMRQTSEGTFHAFLPKVGHDTSSIGYRIATAASPAARLGEGTITVSKSCVNPPSSKDAKALAHSVIVGLTVEQPIIPQGFLCDGVIASIDPEGDLAAHKCRSAVAGVTSRADARALLVQSGVAIDVDPPQSAGTNRVVSSARP